MLLLQFRGATAFALATFIWALLCPRFIGRAWIAVCLRLGLGLLLYYRGQIQDD